MYKVREAMPSDSAKACEVLRRSISEICSLDYNDQSVIDEWLGNKTESNIKEWIQSVNSYSVVCTNDDHIVGFGTITLEGEVLLLYLVPEALRKGNGKLMLEAMEERIISECIEEIYTVSSITAKPFYERNGYTKNGAPMLVGNIEGEFPLIKRVSPNKSLNLSSATNTPSS